MHTCSRAPEPRYSAEMNRRADGVLARSVTMWSCAGPTGSSSHWLSRSCSRSCCARAQDAHTLSSKRARAHTQSQKRKGKKGPRKKNTGIGMSLADMRTRPSGSERSGGEARKQQLPHRSTCDFMRWPPRSDGSGASISGTCRVLNLAIFELVDAQNPGWRLCQKPIGSLA